MSVILFACVVRMRDGLPLSASTDFHSNKDFMECRKRLKILSSNLAQCPVRGTAKGCNLNIHFHTCGDVTFMSICSSSFPAAMAFCFLEALHWEFSASYDSISVGLASRPYAFLEFDGMIQKVKQHFNEVGCSRKDIQEELPAPAPVILQLEEMNGVVNGHAVPLLESVLFVPVLYLGEDAEDIWTVGLHLPVQHLLTWTEEPLANSLPHWSGYPVGLSDIEKKASGKAIGLSSLKKKRKYHFLSQLPLPPFLFFREFFKKSFYIKY
ncbi:vesicle-trafficking protein SEC22c isoform X3 [Rhinatrema bivittatum]|uniref:vesicle-trafficking protein SEC22c isoform X3 n=1 Tax=Rhinatrema bivittatum TaxID=194408 RepID=UPI001129E1C9|nr:vesicle-trafficking protein SEC22c isoform X3 [Rhinatrema bivittatum]